MVQILEGDDNYILDDPYTVFKNVMKYGEEGASHSRYINNSTMVDMKIMGRLIESKTAENTPEERMNRESIETAMTDHNDQMINHDTHVKIKENSIFQVEYTDEKDHLYNIYIYAEDELKKLSTGGGGTDPGGTIVSGTYQAYIENNDMFEKQSIPLFGGFEEGVFNLSATDEKWVYVLSSNNDDMPDFLIVEQYGYSSGNAMNIFIVQQGNLKRMTLNHNGKTIDDLLVLRRGEGVLYDNNRLITRSFVSNEAEGSYISKSFWEYDHVTHQLVQMANEREDL